MLRAVLRVEWTSTLRERPLWIVLLAFAGFVAFASLASRQFVHAERALVDQVSRHERRTAVLDEHATVVSLPQAPLAAIAIGQRDLLPQVLTLTTRARLIEAREADTMSPARRASGPFDLAFVLVYLLPLVVIATSFDLISSERERGTLALVLSQPVSLRAFVFGKAAVRAAIVVGLALVLAACGAFVAGARLAGPGALVALVTFAALVVAYALFWFALALAVGAWGRSSAANALGLVGAWLALVVIVPGLGSVAVDTLHPSPSRVELVNATREAAREAATQATALEGDHGKPKGGAEEARRAVAIQSDLERRVQPVVQGFRDRVSEQQALVDRLRFASPALLMNEALTDVSGSGVTRHQDFMLQVDVFHDGLKRWFTERVASGQALGASVATDTLPRFAYVEPRVGATSRVAPALIALAAMIGGLVALALRGLRAGFSRGLR